jgi:cysteine desulfurase family protein (TIGR01976 family)
VDVVPEDCTLDLDDLRAKLNPRVKLLAVTCASNAVGTINNVREICSLAHGVGARVFLDAVHYAPHGQIDVQHWECDFLACSAYKFFGPHVGILWGRRELLEAWTPDKVRPAPDDLPGRWMTGTPNFEGLAGVAAAIEYLASLAGTGTGPVPPTLSRRQRIVSGLGAIQTHETTLARRLLAGLARRPAFRVWGITDETRLSWRVPTVAITSERHRSEDIARHLAKQEIYVWSGNLYAVELAERLGVEARGGFVRLGLVHYNLPGEVDRLLEALDEIPA